MKRTVLLIVLPIVAVIAVLAILFGLFGIAPRIVRGSGPIVERAYPLEGFDRVEVSSAIEFEITHGAYSINVTGYENLIERLEIDRSGQTLKIGLRPGSYFRNNVRAIIAMPALNKLLVSGACRGSAKGVSSVDDFDLEVSGASRVEVDIEATSTAVEVSGASRLTGELLVAQNSSLVVSGASRCELTGLTYDMNLDLSGASRATLSEFQAANADVNISGASQAIINVIDTLDVDLSGASSLEYAGDPTLGRVSITGASRMSSR